MQKTWNLTFYADGKPVSERNGVSQSDAVVELYRLARGEADGMVSLEQLRAFDAGAVDIAGAGHNAMLEAPGAVWDWFARA